MRQQLRSGIQGFQVPAEMGRVQCSNLHSTSPVPRPPAAWWPLPMGGLRACAPTQAGSAVGREVRKVRRQC